MLPHLLLVCVSANVFAIAGGKDPCSLCNHEVYDEHASICTKNCATKDRQYKCTAEEVPGCYCKPGYLRNMYGECVPESECPEIEMECLLKHEKYTTCGSRCPNTCKSITQPPHSCLELCVSGCFCEAGYVRNEESGECVLAQDCPKPECLLKHEEYATCGPFCPDTCQSKTQPRRFCPALCVSGCFCEAGYVRNEECGECVLAQDCPKPDCPKHEMFSECGKDCQMTCPILLSGEPQICTKICKPGCVCEPGYVRIDKDKKCIPEEKCYEGCPKNEIYNECGSYCAPTCKTILWGIAIDCIDACKPGCFCKPGYVRIDKDKKCIPEEKCYEGCPKNEIYNECGSYCAPTCKTILGGIAIDCIDACKPGCFCKPGYVRIDEDKKCIPEDKCYKGCPKHEMYNNCGSHCEPTCKTILGGIIIECIDACKPGCFCKPGYVRIDEDKKCIPEDKCYKGCPKHEIYNDCGSHCEPTCESFLEGITIKCKDKCKPGCYCKPGFVRIEPNGKCIPEEKCYEAYNNVLRR